jgi:hypothetical protein
MTLVDSTYVQDALEDQRQDAEEDVGRVARNIMADHPTLDLDELIAAAKKAGALNQVCAEHGITEAVMARRLPQGTS